MSDVIPVESDFVIDALTTINGIGRDIGSGDFRRKIMDIERAIGSIPGSVIGEAADKQFEIKHTFANGIYVRDIFIPKGILGTGRIHKYDHPYFILQGDISVATEYEGVQRLRAPLSLISRAGTKRLVYAHEDTRWITIHRTDETDLDKLIVEIMTTSYEEFERMAA